MAPFEFIISLSGVCHRPAREPLPVRQNQNPGVIASWFRIRGQQMQRAVPVGRGAMAAVVGLDPKKIDETLSGLAPELGVVAVAGYNSLESGHATHFFNERLSQVQELGKGMNRPPIMVCPYDAELFGHWWWEGPQFLEFFIRKAAYDQNTFDLMTPYDYLKKYPDNQVAQPSASSWGHKGYHEYWLGEKNDWIYRHLNKAAERMIELAQNHPHSIGLEKRALNQAARELLLAQSSDWAFIMTTGTMVDYAVKRTKNHISRFNRLFDDINKHEIDPDWLTKVENMDNIFPDIDFRVYS